MFTAVIMAAFITALVAFLVVTDHRALRAGEPAVAHPLNERESMRIHPTTLRNAT